MLDRLAVIKKTHQNKKGSNPDEPTLRPGDIDWLIEQVEEKSNFEDGMNRLTFEKPMITVGYSSHGEFCSLGEIIEVETERDNEPFTNFSDKDLLGYSDCSAIWVTRNPMNAFRYVLSASEWEMSEEEIIEHYPNWREDIEEIDCTNLYEVSATDDGDDGILMVDLRNFPVKQK